MRCCEASEGRKWSRDVNATLLEVKLGLELKMTLSFWLAFEVEPLDATAVLDLTAALVGRR